MGERWTLNQLRRWLGPHPDDVAELTHTRGELAVAQQRLVRQAAEHRAAVAGLRGEYDDVLREAVTAAEAARAHERGAQRALWDAYEPEQGPDCTKVRLRSQDEATDYARYVEREVGAPAGSLVGYRCRKCPRQPVSTAHFWHIHNPDPERRTGRQTAARERDGRRRAARRAGLTIRQRVPQEVLDRITGGLDGEENRRD